MDIRRGGWALFVTSWNSVVMRVPKRYPAPTRTLRTRTPDIRSASGSGSESQRMNGWAPSRSSMARMIAPMAMRTTPNRYQMRTGREQRPRRGEKERPLQELEIAHLHARPVSLATSTRRSEARVTL